MAWNMEVPLCGPGDEPSNAASQRGQIRGRTIERPLIEVARGRRLEVMRSVSARGLIEVTHKNDGYENREYMRPKSEQ